MAKVIDWKPIKIQDVCKVVSGATPRTAESSYWNGDVSWITPMDLSKINSKYIGKGMRSISQEGLKSCSAELFPPKSLIMSSRAPIGYFAINTKQAATNQGCKTFICSNSVDVEFLYYYLLHNLDKIKRFGSGSTFAEVGKKHLENFAIQIPTMFVQKKIGTILNEIDIFIDKTDQIIQKTEVLKHGLMKKLFKKKSNWKNCKIDDYFIVTNGKTNSDDAVLDGNYPLFDRSIEIKQSNKYLFNTEAVIIPGEGKEFIPRYYFGKFDLHQRAYAIFSKNNNKERTKFLFYWINCNKSYLLKMAVGSTVKSLRLYMLKNFPLSLPKYEEQDKIVKILSIIDEKIINNKKLKEKQIQFKNGLMQDIFSQKIQIVL